MRNLPVLLLLAMLCIQNASAEALHGGITHDDYQPEKSIDSDDRKKINLNFDEIRRRLYNIDMAKEFPVIHPSPASSPTEIQSPPWIKGNVYTNERLVLRTYRQVSFMLWGTPHHKELKYKIPDKKVSNLDLGPDVLAYWNGYKPPLPCTVTVIPHGPKGNFRFFHNTQDGPRGYLEHIGRDEKGFRTYRYWYEEPAPTCQNTQYHY